MNATSHESSTAAPAERPSLKPIFRLQWEPAQSAYVLLYPEGMVKLNQSAAEILKRCDGTRDVNALVAELERAFETTGIDAEVRAFLAEAHTRGWIA